MPVEMGLWRVDGEPVRLLPGGMPTEARLEELIETEPTILGEPLLIIGRQVRTSFGGIIDLLAVDAEGVLHVIELKKDKTPREVVAQALG
jgi:RecB family endonuclease NucS